MSQQAFHETVAAEEQWREELEAKHPSLRAWPGKESKMSVYKAINNVQSALAKTGISKDRTNTQGAGYKFRGIDDVYNAVAPLLAEHGLCIIPRMLTRTCEDRLTKAGGNLFYVTVEAEFDFVCAEDGSKHTARTFGEAMDSGDKATNKAMSAAYKYACFQTFAIPTEGDNDADAHTHQVAPRSAVAPSFKSTPTDGPVDVPEERRTMIELAASLGANKFKAGEKDQAFDCVAPYLIDNEEMLFMQQVLKPQSTFRAYIKFRQEAARKAQPEPATVD
jgi:hypothetical protein